MNTERLKRKVTLTAANLSSNVDGSMLGNSLRATGSKSSMKGTMTKTANGISLSRYVVVRLSCIEGLIRTHERGQAYSDIPVAVLSLSSSLHVEFSTVSVKIS